MSGPTRLIRCPWCPRHYVARRPRRDTAEARFAVLRDAFELLIAHAAETHGRSREQVVEALAERLKAAQESVGG